MMKRKMILILLAVLLNGLGRCIIASPKDSLSAMLMKNDFSDLWCSQYQQHTLGYKGRDYTRFYIHIAHVEKCNDSTYCLDGYTKTQGEISTFSRDVSIKKIRQLSLSEEKHSKCHRYEIITEWNLKEKNKGVYWGVMKSYFYLAGGRVCYDDSDIECSDSFSNNLFEGIWKSVESKQMEKCCWGDFRIPACGDLDTGAAEFVPNRKYLNSGWESYYNAYQEGTEEAWKKEFREWWKE